jgi:hypothetical protein
MFLVGLVVRPLLIFSSVACVVYLAVRIASLERRSHGTLILAALHLVLVVGSGIVAELAAVWSGSAIPWAWLQGALSLVVPLMLYWRLRRLLRTARTSGSFITPGREEQRHEARNEAPASGTEPAGASGIEKKTATRIGWIIGVTGTLAPWIVGLGVKIYLDAVGRPTLPVASFLEPLVLPVLVIATMAMWSFPFLVLALVARFWLLVREKPAGSFRRRLWLVWLTYGFGIAVVVPVFVSVFWEFDTLYLFVPIGLFICPFMALGFGVGLMMIRKEWIPG